MIENKRVMIVLFVSEYLAAVSCSGTIARFVEVEMGCGVMGTLGLALVYRKDTEPLLNIYQSVHITYFRW